MKPPPIAVGPPKVEALKNYIAANRDNCKRCEAPMFWVSTANGKRIPMDYPDFHYKHDKTHELIVGWSEEGVWTGDVEAWPAPKSRATHSVHLSTCKGKP